MKPSFLKMKKVYKCLFKSLIIKVVNGACGENDALMKKGLRRFMLPLIHSLPPVKMMP